ncbi:MAG: SDR family oxidoreductase [Candidatus Kariarchaeaceae archaeon]
MIEEINTVTGAFSYTGSFIAKELLKLNDKIRTLTNHPKPDVSYYEKTEVFPYHFDNYEKLVTSLEGVTTFFNTYWIRFPKKNLSWDIAVDNSRLLFDACRDAKVKKIVHISVTNPTLNSPHPYFKGKAQVEEHLQSTGIPYTIIRPALIFELGDILLNNIAYLMRKFHVFGIFGSGNFKIQPIYQRDLAKIAVNFRYQMNQLDDSLTTDAIGPEIYTFNEIIEMIRVSTNTRVLILRFPRITRILPFLVSKILGIWYRDTLLTWHEMEALRNNLLLTDSTPNANTSFRKWLQENGSKLGLEYAHEINRHY